MTEFRALALIFIAMVPLTFGAMAALFSVDAKAEVIGLVVIAILGASSFATSSVVVHYGAKRRQR